MGETDLFLSLLIGFENLHYFFLFLRVADLIKMMNKDLNNLILNFGRAVLDDITNYYRTLRWFNNGTHIIGNDLRQNVGVFFATAGKAHLDDPGAVVVTTQPHKFLSNKQQQLLHQWYMIKIAQKLNDFLDNVTGIVVKAHPLEIVGDLQGYFDLSVHFGET